MRVGKPKSITLGPWPGITLSAARLEAAKQAALRARGALRPELSPITVKELAQEYFEKQLQEADRERPSQPRPAHRRAGLGLRASEVRVQDIEILVKGMQQMHRSPLTAFLAFIKQCCGYGVAARLLETSSADKLTAAVAGGAEKARSRTLTDAEIRVLWHADSKHTRLVRLLKSTSVIGEAQLARWGHFDLRVRRWVIPAQHANNKRAHWAHCQMLC